MLLLGMRHRLFFFFFRSHIYSKLGTHCLAEATAQAFALFDYLDHVIALGTELIGHLQYTAGTKFSAIAAALAPVYINMHPDRPGGLIGHIKRLSPQLHIGTALTIIWISLRTYNKEITAGIAGYDHVKKKV